MSGPISVEVAREQLRELIAILGELRNAGPRDQRFKQWRQITVTLLQRLWPSDPSRAERFRRIPFSAPMGKTDRHATQQYFGRGCKEASTYLVQLAAELGCVVEPLPETPTVYDDDGTPAMEEENVVEPHMEAAGGEGLADAMLPDVGGSQEEPVESSMPVPPEPRKPAAGPRPRLKDMLGFTDEAAPDHTPVRSEPVAPPPPPRATEVEYRPQAAPPPPQAPRAPARPAEGTSPPKSVRFRPVEPSPIRGETPRPVAPPPPAEEPSWPVESQAPPEAYAPQDEAAALEHDLASEFVTESPVLQSRARALREPDVSIATPPDVREVLELAGLVEEFGVSPRESAIVRAALIDLARQMESPPVYWGALQETVGFAMHHPELARRVLPLVLPYLDRAA